MRQVDYSYDILRRMISIVWLILGCLLLWKGGDWLVDGSTSLGIHFNIPKAVLGLSLVAFGTSAPELIVSIFASLSQKSDIILGNIIGSNIANSLLILGIMATLTVIRLHSMEIKQEIIINVLASLCLFLLVVYPLNSLLILSRGESVIFLIGFVFFLYMLFRTHPKDASYETSDMLIGHVPESSMRLSRSFLLFLFGTLLLPMGGYLVVKGATLAALSFSLSESLISLLAVALGTSLPECVASVIAAFKNEPEIAVGNVIGSNIFNIFLILGISGLIRPIEVPSFLMFDVGIVLGISIVILLAFLWYKKGVSKKHGFLLLCVYALYVYMTVIRG
jgi:cation:H+ antiporter